MRNLRRAFGLEEPAVAAFATLVAVLGLPIGVPARLVIGAAIGLVASYGAATGATWAVRPPIDRTAAWWLGALGCWAAVASVFGIDPATSLWYLLVHASFVLVGASVVAAAGWHGALQGLLVGISIPVAVAGVSLLGPLTADRLFDVADRAVITQDMAAFFGTVFACIVLFAPKVVAGIPVLINAWWLRHLAVVVSLVLIVATNSRTMAVAAIVGLAVGLAHTGRSTHVAWAVLVALAAIMVSVIGFGVDASRLIELTWDDIVQGGGREDLWAALVEAIRDKPLFGHGLGSQDAVLREYRFESLFAVKRQTTQSTVLYAMVAAGIPAAALLVGATVAMWRASTGPVRALLAVLVVFGLGDAPIEQPGIASLLFGISIAADQLSQATSVRSAPASRPAESESGV